MSTEKEYPIAEDLRKTYEQCTSFRATMLGHETVDGMIKRIIERVSRAEGQLAEMLHLFPHDLAVFASRWPVTQAELERLERENAALKVALDKLARLGNEPHYGNSRGNEIALAALNSTPQLDSLACPTCGSNRRDIRGTIHTEYLTRECADGWHQSALKPQCSSPTE